MGFAVVHMMKIGKGGVRGIQSHNQREKESRKILILIRPGATRIMIF